MACLLGHQRIWLLSVFVCESVCMCLCSRRCWTAHNSAWLLSRTKRPVQEMHSRVARQCRENELNEMLRHEVQGQKCHQPGQLLTAAVAIKSEQEVSEWKVISGVSNHICNEKRFHLLWIWAKRIDSRSVGWGANSDPLLAYETHYFFPG